MLFEVQLCKSTPGFLVCASLHSEWQCNENNLKNVIPAKLVLDPISGSGNPLKQTSRFSNQFSKSPFVAKTSRFCCCASQTVSVIALAWDSLKPESFRFSAVPNVSIVKNGHLIFRNCSISISMDHHIKLVGKKAKKNGTACRSKRSRF